MSFCRQLEDGVLFLKNEEGDYYYSMPCKICGKEIKVFFYRKNSKHICEQCRKVIAKKKKIEQEQIKGINTTAERRFEKAIANIEKQSKDISDYNKAIKAARTATEKYGSIPEVMVAIELLKLGYKIIPQQKVGKYKVDFAIPSLKLVIEVDGEMWHGRARKDGREGILQLTLGLDWKIIHIPAELIAKDINKLNTIIKSLMG